MEYLVIISLIIICPRVNGFEPFVVGGDFTKIQHYPHSIYLNVDCKMPYLCGGSILNQDVVLTAAHCLEDCRIRNPRIIIKYGHEKIKNMKSTQMAKFVMHEDYDEETLNSDIGVVTCKTPIQLGTLAKRVAIHRTHVSDTNAYIAGWGVVDDQGSTTGHLKHTAQKLQKGNVCKLIGQMPKGSFCAGPINGLGYPDSGDSGSALVVDSYIQIGIVSFKVRAYSLVAYTNVTYYYDWIQAHAKKMLCGK